MNIKKQILFCNRLLDFTIMAIVSTTLSAIVVILNGIGLEMYTKLCYKSMLPTSSNLITAGKNETDVTAVQQPNSNTPVNWVGDCGALD